MATLLHIYREGLFERNEFLLNSHESHDSGGRMFSYASKCLPLVTRAICHQRHCTVIKPSSHLQCVCLCSGAAMRVCVCPGERVTMMDWTLSQAAVGSEAFIMGPSCAAKETFDGECGIREASDHKKCV